MEPKKRTADEIIAYLDGYNACYKQFCECIKSERSRMDAIKKMRTLVNLVNDIGGREKQE